MSLIIEVYNASGKKYLPRKKIGDIVERVLTGEKIGEARVSVVLVDDSEIHSLNKKFLDHDRTTDVISFPMDEEILDGEIYISVDTAERQAAEYNVSLANELMRLAAHGTLHLTGYGDLTKKEKILMQKLENKYLFA